MNEIQEATGIIARLIPFFTLCLSIRYVNLKQKYRYRQVLMPIAALIFSILISFRVDGIAENSVRYCVLYNLGFLFFANLRLILGQF